MNIYQLKTTNFQNIHMNKLENDFYFIVNHQIYSTNRIVADFISPKISRIHETDYLLSNYSINTKYKGNFERVLKYIYNGKIELNEEEKKYFLDIFYELENFQEFYNISPLMEENINQDNVIDKINFKYEHSIKEDDEIIFLCEHFEEIYESGKEKFSSLEPYILSNIFENEHFQIKNEDFLFNIILELVSKSEEYFILFEHVAFVNVSIPLIKKFVQVFNIDYITQNIWKNICFRLEEPLHKEIESDYINLQEDNKILLKENTELAEDIQMIMKKLISMKKS